MVFRFQRTFRDFAEGTGGEDRICEPAVDIFETKGHLLVEVELPGVKREDIEVYVIRDRLFIQAYKREDLDYVAEGGKRAYLCLERECGKYYREIELVVPCKAAQGKVRLENGILCMEFEKVEDRRGQRRDLKIE